MRPGYTSDVVHGRLSRYATRAAAAAATSARTDWRYAADRQANPGDGGGHRPRSRAGSWARRRRRPRAANRGPRRDGDGPAPTVEGLEPAHPGQTSERERSGPERDQARPVPVGQCVHGEGRAGHDGQPHDAGPLHDEGSQQPPGADPAEQQRSEHRDGAQEGEVPALSATTRAAARPFSKNSVRSIIVRAIPFFTRRPIPFCKSLLMKRSCRSSDFMKFARSRAVPPIRIVSGA